MPALLIKILRPLAPWLAGAAALLAAALYVVTLRHELSASRTKAAQLAAINAEDAAAIASYKAQQAKWSAAEAALDARSRIVVAGAARISARIAGAAPADDAAVAPVLSHALDDLRALQGGKS